MPCRSDYMEPNEREKESQRVAMLLIYTVEKLGSGKVSGKLVKTATDPYGNVVRLDRDTAELCSLIRSMNPEQLNRIVYDGRDANARKLADWWEHHEEADKLREANERHIAEHEAAKRRILEKLTDKERKVLGL